MDAPATDSWKELQEAAKAKIAWRKIANTIKHHAEQPSSSPSAKGTTMCTRFSLKMQLATPKKEKTKHISDEKVRKNYYDKLMFNKPEKEIISKSDIRYYLIRK